MSESCQRIIEPGEPYLFNVNTGRVLCCNSYAYQHKPLPGGRH